MGVAFCTRCVISNQRPLASREYARTDPFAVGRMAFDAEGVCAACRVAEAKEATDWKAKREELGAILARYRRTDGRPDVIVPGSGGKDSVYAAHVLRDEFGMHPLTVTWAPHRYTEVGWRNFQAWLEQGFDNLLVTPNPKVHRVLTRLAFQRLGHPFQPFVLGQRSLAPKLAAAHDIALVVYGEDDAEYEGQAGWQEDPEYRPERLATLRLSGVPYEQLVADHGLEPYHLFAYLPPAQAVRTLALGRYIRWQPQGVYYFAAERGFEANEQRTEGTYSKYNSIDDRLDPLHYYLTWIKFGLGRASYDAAQEIRNGHLTRAEGVALAQRFDGEIREETIAWACAYMGITREQFWDTMDQLRIANPTLWHRDTEGEWYLTQTVWNPTRGQRPRVS